MHFQTAAAGREEFLRCNKGVDKGAILFPGCGDLAQFRK